MATLDKNQAVIDYLITCPTVLDNPLFFNFANEVDNCNQMVTHGDEVKLNKPYIDGSVLKAFTFTMLIYKSVAYLPVVKMPGYSDENVLDFAEAQELLDWIVVQNDLNYFPNFGTSCIIESVEPLTNTPVLRGVNKDSQPPLAQYSIGIKITYLDRSKCLWS